MFKEQWNPPHLRKLHFSGMLLRSSSSLRLHFFLPYNVFFFISHPQWWDLHRVNNFFFHDRFCSLCFCFIPSLLPFFYH